MKGLVPLALTVGVIAFLYTEFALNFTFHWFTDGDLGNGLDLPKNFHLAAPAAFVSYGIFFACGDNAFTKVTVGCVVGALAGLIMMFLVTATSGLPDFWAISLWIAVMAAGLVLLGSLGDYYHIPTTFVAFASVVFWWIATGLDGWAEGGGGVGNSVGALDPAAMPPTAGSGAFAGVISTPYGWVFINVLVTLLIGCLLGPLTTKIVAAITPKDKSSATEPGQSDVPAGSAA